MYKTFSFIFLNEYLKITNEKFRKLLFQKILEKNELIINSSQLFKLIIENVIDINPSDMENNLELIKEKKLPLFKMLNDSKNEVLDEVLFNIFEEKIISFFDSIPKCNNEDLEDIYPQYIKDNKNSKIRNETGIIFDNSFNIFKQVAEFLDEIKDSEKLINDKNENIHLAKLYSIVYVKYYLYKLVVILKEHKKEIKNITKMKEIFNFIKKLSIGFSRVIKIYILKLFYYLMNKNYEDFKAFNFKENFIDFIEEFDLSSDNENNYFLTYFFLPLDDGDYSKYSEEINLFEINKNNLIAVKDEFTKLIKEYGLDIFLTSSINKIISNLGNKTYIKDKIEYSNFSEFIKSLFENNDFSNNKLK